MTTPIENLREVALRLEELRESVVFVGGATLALLVTDPAAPRPRPTDDVDAIARTFSHAQYRTFCERLRGLGFREDPDGPVCRWRMRGIKVDLMPPIESILGFTNRWYRDALAHAEPHFLEGLKVEVVPAPYAVATKLDAFDGRGKETTRPATISKISFRSSMVAKNSAPNFAQPNLGYGDSSLSVFWCCLRLQDSWKHFPGISTATMQVRPASR